MGTQSTSAALTDYQGGTSPAGSRLYVGIDAGRRQHGVASIALERMENGSWERAAVHRISSTGGGCRELVAWLEASGHQPDQVRIGCEPTGLWCAETLVAWLERRGYEVRSRVRTAGLRIYRTLVPESRARIFAGRIDELQQLATESAGLTDVEPILHAQRWLLRQRHSVDQQIDDVERSILAALETSPAEQQAVLQSFPFMSEMRQAVLLACIADIHTFRNDAQLRKLLGWYPEARRSPPTTSGCASAAFRGTPPSDTSPAS